MSFFRKPLYFGAHIGLILFIFLAMGCQSQEDRTLTVGAAASLTNVMEELAPLFTEETGIAINMSYASSGALKQQIMDGAPIDVFVSASQKKMDELDVKNEVEQVESLLKNRMVFVVHPSAQGELQTYSDLIGKEMRLALGEPDSVPAGRYAKEILGNAGLWEPLQSQMVYGKSVRQVADYLSQNEVSAGFIYQTDVSVLSENMPYELIPESLHTPIVYPVALVKDSVHLEQAEAFKTFIKSDQAKSIFEAYGFERIIE